MKKTLLVMAAGMGSRYGGIKQIDPVGASGETIIDYSIFDAVKFGFNKVVFIIRKDIEKDFNEVVLNKLIKKYKDTEFVVCFQSPETSLPKGMEPIQGRTKPLGTTQAILSSKDFINEPFAVVNADDFYGRKSFEIASTIIDDIRDQDNLHGMVGYYLKNTMSKNGSVTRGVCYFENDRLNKIEEHKKIEYVGNDIKSEYEGKIYDFTGNEIVSMNMFVLHNSIFPLLQNCFSDFFKSIKDPLKDEALLPQHISHLISSGKISLMNKNSSETWFGVTYKEDKPEVIKSIRELINKGLYPESIY